MKHPAIEAGDFGRVVAARLSPKVPPFPSAQILLAVGRYDARQHAADFAQIAFVPGLLGQVDVGRVKSAARVVALLGCSRV